MRAAIAVALLPSIALAQGKPEPVKVDPHSLSVPYDPDQTYQVKMQYGLQCVVQIGANEQMLQTIFNPGAPVESINVKNAQSEEPLINYIPLVGAQPGGPTSVTILSKDISGHQRTYPLLVTVLKPPSDGSVADGVCLKLKFTYSAAQVAASVPQQMRGPSPKELQAKKMAEVAKARLNEDPWYGPQNDNFWISGPNQDIAPRYAPHDNGTITLFDFAGPAPSIMLVESNGMPNVCKGKRPTDDELNAPEQTLNQDRYLNMVRVHATAWHFRLRVNSTATNSTPGKVMDIWNCGYRFAAGTGTGGGTGDVVWSRTCA